MQKDESRGSWESENGYIGRSCGRLGTTAVSLLTLEVCYCYLPLHKRGGPVKVIE